MNRIFRWICCWVDLLDALIAILTFTFYRTSLGMDLGFWWYKKRLRARIAARKEPNWISKQ